MVPERGVRMMLGAERGSCRHDRIDFLCIVSSFLLFVFVVFRSSGAAYVKDERMSVL